MDEEENSVGGTIDTERDKEKSGLQREAQKRAKKAGDEAVKQTKKIIKAKKNGKALAGIAKIIAPIIIVVLIIIVLVGTISFLLNMPGNVSQKMIDTVSGFFKSIEIYMEGNDIEASIDDTAILKTLNYLDSMEIDVVAFGFVSKVDRSDTGEITGFYARDWSPFYILDYIVSNERIFITRNFDTLGTLWNNFQNILTGDLEGIKINRTWGQGMLNFYDFETDNDSSLFDGIEIDRENLTMTVRNASFLSADLLKYDMDGWAGRYGTPLELLLALHTSTMMPDLVHEFITNDNLQTLVNISMKETELELSTSLVKPCEVHSGGEYDPNCDACQENEYVLRAEDTEDGRDYDGEFPKLIYEYRQQDVETLEKGILTFEDGTVTEFYESIKSKELSLGTACAIIEEYKKITENGTYERLTPESTQDTTPRYYTEEWTNGYWQSSNEDEEEMTYIQLKLEMIHNFLNTEDSTIWVLDTYNDTPSDSSDDPTYQSDNNLPLGTYFCTSSQLEGLEDGKIYSIGLYHFVYCIGTDGDPEIQILDAPITFDPNKSDYRSLAESMKADYDFKFKLRSIKSLNSILQELEIDESSVISDNYCYNCCDNFPHVEDGKSYSDYRDYGKIFNAIDDFYGEYSRNLDSTMYNSGYETTIIDLQHDKQYSEECTTDRIFSYRLNEILGYLSESITYGEGERKQELEELIKSANITNKSIYLFAYGSHEQYYKTILQGLGIDYDDTDLIVQLANTTDVQTVKTYVPIITSVIKHWYKDLVFDYSSDEKTYSGYADIGGDGGYKLLYTYETTEDNEYPVQEGQPYVIKGDEVTLNGEEADSMDYENTLGYNDIEGILEDLEDEDFNEYSLGDGYKTARKLFTQGYYYQYDGSVQTANEIEIAKKLESCPEGSKIKVTTIDGKLSSVVSDEMKIGAAYEFSEGSDDYDKYVQYNSNDIYIKRYRDNTGETIYEEIIIGKGTDNEQKTIVKDETKNKKIEKTVETYLTLAPGPYISPVEGSEADTINSVEDSVEDSVEEINAILEKAGSDIRRKPVNMSSSTTALSAFSMLEAMHSLDADYVYREFKEFLIELGYYSRAELEQIETDKLDWFIPSYTAPVWPTNKEDITAYGEKLYAYSDIILDEVMSVDQVSSLDDFVIISTMDLPNTTLESAGDIHIYEQTKDYSTFFNKVTSLIDTDIEIEQLLSKKGIILHCNDVLSENTESGTREDGIISLINRIKAVAEEKGVEIPLIYIVGALPPEQIQSETNFEDSLTWIDQTSEEALQQQQQQEEQKFNNFKNKEAIISYNDSLWNYCAMAERITFVDATSGLLTSTGYLDEGFSSITFAENMIDKIVMSEVGNGGFKEGLTVITPGAGYITDISENEITIEFSATLDPRLKPVDGFSMIIKGIVVDTNLINNYNNVEADEEGNKKLSLSRQQVIGATGIDDIIVILRDKNMGVIDNIEDYMPLEKAGVMWDGNFSEEFLFHLARIEGMPTTEGNYFTYENGGVTWNSAKEQACTVGPGLYMYYQYSRFEGVTLDDVTTNWKNFTCTKQEAIDVYIQLLEEHKQGIENWMNENNLTLSQNQVEALIMLSWQQGQNGGRLNAVKNAIKYGAVNLDEVWIADSTDGIYNRRKLEYQLYSEGIRTVQGGKEIEFTSDTPFTDMLEGKSASNVN